jgi:hypothetical protein
MSKLFIAYDWETACPENIILKLKDGRFRYIHKYKKSRINQDWEMSPINPIPIEDFGIDLSYEGDNLIGKTSIDALPTAKFVNGKPRQWFGSKDFVIPCKQNPKNFGVKKEKNEQA